MALGLVLLAIDPSSAQVAEDIPPEQHLAAAIDSGSVVAVKRVLEAGADANTPYEGTSPLVRAVLRGKSYVVDLLCRHGAKVTASDAAGWTPLLWATERGERRVVEVLLKHGADVNVTEPRHQLSALQTACGRGHLSLAELLIEHGARCDHADRFGGTCLEEAAFAGHAKVVELLRQRGMQLEWPLHLAAGLGDRPRVDKLLAAGADVNRHAGGWQNTPLGYAVGGGQLEVAQLLVEHGARLDARNAIGATPLHVAAGHGHAEIVAWLIEKRQSLSTVVDNEGYTPLDWSQHDRVRQLLEPETTATDHSENATRSPQRAGNSG